jgi:hypothetical protein
MSGRKKMSKEINLPDFDDMLKLAEEIGNLSKEVIELKDKRDILIADITMKVTTDKSFERGGKAPAYNFIEATYHKTGYDDETREKIQKILELIAKKTGELEKAKGLFQVMRDIISVWKAQQFNLRESEY